MKIVNAFRIAFSMFSKLPVGQAEWTEDNMKYSMCFVPMIGMVLGALQIGWWYLASALGLSQVFCAVIAVILPLLLTGGIHMDGFCDVVDALSSCAAREKKLQILKDPHIGAFAMLWSVVYILACFGAFVEVKTIEGLWVVSVGYVLSRAVSCLMALLLKNAKKEGSLYTFTSKQEKAIVSGLLMLWILAGILAVCMIDLVLGVLIVIAGAVMVAYYCWMTTRQFGGITGDMAGYLIQMMELIILYAVVIGEIIWRFI